MLDARFTCGATDYPWIEVEVVANDSITVLARLRYGSTYYGQSDQIELAAGVASTFGFEHASPPELRGRTAEVVLVSASDLDSTLATAEVELSLAPDMSCG
jgi:hypothetical protein